MSYLQNYLQDCGQHLGYTTGQNCMDSAVNRSRQAIDNQATSVSHSYLMAAYSLKVYIPQETIRSCSQLEQVSEVHSKRTFKLAWHTMLPLLLSIYSNLLVGLHMFFE